MESKTRTDVAYFFEALGRLTGGEKAALRRSAGVVLADANGKAITAFYRCLPAGTPQYDEEKWFAAACLHCMFAAERTLRIEQIFSMLIADSGASVSTQQRIEGLIDTDWDRDGYMLSKLVRLIKMAKQRVPEVGLNAPALLEDLLYWNNESRSVQRRWARTIFGNNFRKDD